jgi:hypothetical protein
MSRKNLRYVPQEQLAMVGKVHIPAAPASLACRKLEIFASSALSAV